MRGIFSHKTNTPRPMYNIAKEDVYRLPSGTVAINADKCGPTTCQPIHAETNPQDGNTNRCLIVADFTSLVHAGTSKIDIPINDIIAAMSGTLIITPLILFFSLSLVAITCFLINIKNNNCILCLFGTFALLYFFKNYLLLYFTLFARFCIL